MTKVFRVRKYRTGVYKDGKYYHSYKFNHDASDWTYKELEELDCKIKFIFSKNMSAEDIDKVNEKWKHKIL